MAAQIIQFPNRKAKSPEISEAQEKITYYEARIRTMQTCLRWWQNELDRVSA